MRTRLDLSLYLASSILAFVCILVCTYNTSVAEDSVVEDDSVAEDNVVVEDNVASDKSSPSQSIAIKAASPLGLPDRGALESLSVETGHPGQQLEDGLLVLSGSESRQQLVINGHFASGQIHDMTRNVTYTTGTEGTVAISESGVVTPLANGQTTIHIRTKDATDNGGSENGGGDNAGRDTVLTTMVRLYGEDPHVNFTNQIVPVFTKFGCNGGGCHGKSGGQNGFRLALLGFEPAEDFEFLTKEARGRRLSLAAPEHSLLLLKATGEVPHGGGPKLTKGDPSYNLIRRWIAEGAEFGDPEAAKVASVSVYPEQRLMARNSQQQLVVIAHYTDGRTEDVSAMAKYEANVTDMADISGDGLVSIADQAGDVAVMIRYQSQVAVFRATIPLGAPVETTPPVQNFIDELVFAKLRLLGMPPSELSDDETFLRRVTVDICGRIPTRDEVLVFQSDSSPSKRQSLIDDLLASTDYADNFANKWSAILRNKRQNNDYKRGTYAFHHWIRQSIHNNLPFDQFVRAIVAASGEVGQYPPVAWYREVNEINEQVEDTAQLFLGMRIQCARCHHHPFEKWSRRDYYSFSAFFSRVGRKDGEQPGEANIHHRRGMPTAQNPKNNETLKPAGLGGDALDVRPESDPRHLLVDWMAEPTNPFFARMLVNRYWKHFLDRGLVDPEDDMRATNPASNPELLDALADSFIQSGFDLKQLVRTICNSSVYQLSSEPNEYNISDKQAFSRYYPKRLKAETLLDAIDQVTGAATQFDGVPAGTRAIQLPDSGFDNYFLKVFGRPESSSACECERSADANLAQSLHLINSSDIHNKISADTGRAAELAAETRERAAKIRDLYLAALARDPLADETKSLIDYLDRKTAENSGDAVQEQNRDQNQSQPELRPAYEDIVWTLINTKEFLFNH